MKKHFTWLVLILLLQTGILYGVNKYFHVDDITVAAPMPQTVNQPKEPEIDKGDVLLVGTSFDKNFYAVAYNKRLEVYRPTDAKPIFGVDVPEGMYISVMHWLPDEDRLLYALARSKNYKTGSVEVHVIDVSSKKDDEVKTLKKLGRGSYVKTFALSTYTNMLYLDIEDTQERDYIYQINIMKRLQRISLPTRKIGNIALASREDTLFYEDSVRRQVFYYDGRKVNMITPDDWDYCLLGITKDDKLYIGRLDDGKVTSIYKTDKDGNMDLFADLSSDVPRENFLLGLNGQLVIKQFPAEKYIAVIKPDGQAKTFNSMNTEAFITGDAIFYVQDGEMHITYLE